MLDHIGADLPRACSAHSAAPIGRGIIWPLKPGASANACGESVTRQWVSTPSRLTVSRVMRFERLRRPLEVIATTSTWLAAVAFLGWSARLAFLEGYIYEIPKNFSGDFSRTVELGDTEWWTGQGIFYGPIFVVESLFLVVPRLLSPGDFARLDFVLFALAFGCVWLALFGLHHPRLALLVLAAWLGHHMSVEAFANTAHLEILELALISLALLLATRGYVVAAGGALGLAMAVKTLPGLFVPYLAITRQWRMLASALVCVAVPFLIVCWIQQVTPWDGLYSLVYQGGNLTKLEFTEYEYTPRAEIARMFAGDGGTLSPEQARIAIAIHASLGLATALFAGWVMLRSRSRAPRYGLMFGLIGAVMLVAAPSAHAAYYVFLLPGWTALVAELVGRPRSAATFAMWLATIASYVLTGFDQPFFLLERYFGFGIIVPQHWLAWHLPSLGLLLTVATLSLLLLRSLNEAVLPYRSTPADTAGTALAVPGRA